MTCGYWCYILLMSLGLFVIGGVIIDVIGLYCNDYGVIRNWWCNPNPNCKCNSNSNSSSNSNSNSNPVRPGLGLGLGLGLAPTLAPPLTLFDLGGGVVVSNTIDGRLRDWYVMGWRRGQAVATYVGVGDHVVATYGGGIICNHVVATYAYEEESELG